jgi:hypothetical protein
MQTLGRAVLTFSRGHQGVLDPRQLLFQLLPRHLSHSHRQPNEQVQRSAQLWIEMRGTALIANTHPHATACNVEAIVAQDFEQLRRQCFRRTEQRGAQVNDPSAHTSERDPKQAIARIGHHYVLAFG